MKNRSSVTRAIPSAFAALALIGVLLVPRAEPMYVRGHVIAIVSSLAATISFFALKDSREDRNKLFLLGVGLLGTISAVTGGLLLSFGSKAGASGDIGGFPMWLLSTIGLLVLVMIAATEGRTRLTSRNG